MSTQIDDDQNESRTETVVIYSQNIQLVDNGRGTDHRFAFVYLMPASHITSGILGFF